jgi:L-lactate dehydrogenase complex protein LldF
VCPVRINIPEVLVHLRGEVVRSKQRRLTGRLDSEQVAMRALARIFATPQNYERAQRLGRLGQGIFVHNGVIDRLPGLLSGWTTMRDLQPIRRQSFRDWWREEHRAATAQPRAQEHGAPHTAAEEPSHDDGA